MNGDIIAIVSENGHDAAITRANQLVVLGKCSVIPPFYTLTELHILAENTYPQLLHEGKKLGATLEEGA